MPRAFVGNDGSARWSPAPLVRASFGLSAAAVVGAMALPVAWPWFGGAILANHALLGAIGMRPRSTWLGPNLVRLPVEAVDRRQVALTFDDGPDPRVTPAVLDLLDRYDAKASFFFIGQLAAAYPAIVREVVARGHDVENHSDCHLTGFACLPPAALAREVGAAQERLADITGIPPRFFRPPMGLRSPLLDPVLGRLGLLHVSWTRRGFDTRSTEPSIILRRLCRKLAAGDILLLHDGRSAHADSGLPVVLEVLPLLLARFGQAKLKPVSVACGVELSPTCLGAASRQLG